MPTVNWCNCEGSEFCSKKCNIKCYSRDKLEREHNSLVGALRDYSSREEYGVTTIRYKDDITATFHVLTFGMKFVAEALSPEDSGYRIHHFKTSSGEKVSAVVAGNNKIKNKKAKELLNEGMQLLNARNYRSAHSKLSEAYNTATEDYKEREKMFTNMNVAKDNILTQLKREAEEKWNQRDFAGSLCKFSEAFNECDDGHSEKKFYLTRQGDCHKMMGNYTEAFMFYENALQIDATYDFAKKNKAETLNLFGNSLYNRGNFTEALEKYQSASEIEHRPEISKVYLYNVARCYRRQNNFETAIEAYDRVLQIDSSYELAKNERSLALNSLGDVALNDGKLAEAANFFLRALQGCTEGFESRQLLIDNWQKSQNVNNNGNSGSNVNQSQAGNNETETKNLVRLRQIWSEFWNLENSDEDEESAKMLQTLIRKSTKLSQEFPNCKEYAEYKEMASLKFEGNEKFNHAVEMHKNSIKSLSDAKCANKQENTRMAMESITKADNCIIDAVLKFEKGKTLDEKFDESIKLARQTLNAILKLEMKIENDMERISESNEVGETEINQTL